MYVRQSTMIASLFALIAVCLWGVSFVSTKAVLYSIDSGTLLITRFGIGALFLLMMLIIQKKPVLLPVYYLPHILILSVLGVFVHQLLQASALLTIDASSAGWMISFTPVFTVALSIFFLHERLTILKTIGILFAVAGVLFISSGSENQTISFSTDIGYIFMLLSTLNWAVYSILLKYLNISLPPLTITFYMCFFGALLSMPLFLISDGLAQLQKTGVSDWAHLLFLGVFVSGIAYLFWIKAVQTLSASRASAFLYFEPIATLIAATIILHEKIVLISVLGGVIIIGGVALMNDGLSGREKRE